MIPTRYTKPLSEDYITDGHRLIQLIELCWVTPESDEPIRLDEWQKDLLRRVLERYPANHPKYPNQLRYRQVLISMGRQNGKTVIGGGLALDALTFAKGDVTSIASSREQAQIIYDRVKHVIDSTPSLKRRFKRTTDTRGIKKGDGSGNYKVSPAKEAALQGLPFIRVLVDEGHLAKKGIWTAAIKGTSSFNDAQVIMITTAGDAESETLIELYKSAAKAIAGEPGYERFGAFIWEAPAGCAIDDPDAIKQANPAVACGRIPIDRILGDILTQPELEVRRYTLNQFVESKTESFLPAQMYNDAIGTGVNKPEDGIVLAVDTQGDWDSAVIAVAGVNGDIYESEIISSIMRPDENKLFREILDLFNKHKVMAVTLDKRKHDRLAYRLKQAGIPTFALLTTELYATYSAVYALFATGRIRHDNHPLLQKQVPLAMAKYSSDSWMVSRTESLGDVDAVMATFMALYVRSVQDTGVQIQVF